MTPSRTLADALVEPDLPRGVVRRLALGGHTRCLGGVAFSPDGAVLATGSFDRSVRVWDAGRGSLARVLVGGPAGIRCVAVARDGARIYGGCDDARILAWSPASDEPAAVLERHAGPVMALACSADGRVLASGSQDKTAQLWVDARATRTLPHGDWCAAVALAPDGTLVATGADDGLARVWDATSGELVRVLKAHRSWVRGVAFSPDGRLLATGSFDGTVRIWDLARGTVLETLELGGRQARAIEISSDGALLAVSVGRAIRLWRTSTWEPVAELPGHGFRFRPGADELVVHDEDDTMARLLCLSGLEPGPARPVDVADAVVRAPTPADVTGAPSPHDARPAREPLAVWAGGDRAMLALVFTDVVDSSALGVELGEERMGALRRDHFSLVRTAIRSRRGREVKTIGDAFLVLFRTAVDALDFARDVLGRSRDHALRVRIGVHVGPVQIEDDDAFGSTVNYAARVEAQAAGGEVWLSDRAKEDVDGELAVRHRGLAWRAHPGRSLKGFPGEHRLWSLGDEHA